MNNNTEINFCPCCGTNLRAVSLALGFAANPTPATPPAPREPRKPHNDRKRVGATTEQKIIQLAEPGDLTRKEVGRKIGVAKTTVYRVLRRLRPDLLRETPAAPAKTKRTPITTEERANVLALKKQGKKAVAIAAELKMPKQRVNSIYYKH